ncbi:MAG: hypothetical protein JWM59_3620, partial [Verrucomicrobiales bacterium]|nr:hypothetical protein [Verrucomicrobiales bacterium]
AFLPASDWLSGRVGGREKNLKNPGSPLGRASAEVGPQAGSDRNTVAGDHAVLSLELTRTGAVLSWSSDPACLHHPQHSGDLRRWTNLTAAPLAGTGDSLFTAHCRQTAVFERIALLIPQHCSRKLTDRCSGLGVPPRECLFAGFRTFRKPVHHEPATEFPPAAGGGCRSRPVLAVWKLL